MFARRLVVGADHLSLACPHCPSGRQHRVRISPQKIARLLPALDNRMILRHRSVEVQVVSNRGDAPALTAVLGGQVQVYFATIQGAMEVVRTGKLRALAVTTSMRSGALPDIPILGEYVPGYQASGWLGVGAPKNTPAEIIEKLNKEINVGLADPKMKAQLASLGATPLAGSSAEFATLIAQDTLRS
jgi:tripartite-type tricarboxylate transporter receptor subunit TctC